MIQCLNLVSEYENKINELLFIYCQCGILS